MSAPVLRRGPLAALALAAALAVSLCATSVAGATHTIYPGVYWTGLSPTGTLHWGIPAPEALVSHSATTNCLHTNQVGTSNLAGYIHHWWGARTTGIEDCRPSASLHSEGRAIDYHVNKNIAGEKAVGDSLFGFWRKQDTATTGNQGYMPMRRFGIQEIIWNCRIYSATNMAVRTYYRCDPGHPDYSTSPTLRHEDHVHIGQNWNGAQRKTTAWSGYRPCYAGHAGC